MEPEKHRCDVPCPEKVGSVAREEVFELIEGSLLSYTVQADVKPLLTIIIIIMTGPQPGKLNC